MTSLEKRALTFTRAVVGEIPETLYVCFSLRWCPFLLNICQMWWVAGLPKSEGLANSFLKLVSLLSLSQWENGPPHLAAKSASLFVPNTCCAFTVGSGLLSLGCLLFWVQQDSLSSPSFPLPTSGTVLLFWAAPLWQPLAVSVSLCGSTSALLHREEETLVPNRRLGNVTLK